MTEQDDGSAGTPRGDVPTVDVLAELHAGALEPGPAGELGRRVLTDPGAQAVLRALDATVADLAVLRSEPVAVRLPADVAARLDAALAAAGPPATRPGPATAPPPPAPPAPPAPVLDLAAARRARVGRRGRLGAGVLAAAAAVAAVVVLGGLPGAGATSGTATAQPVDLGNGALGRTVLASLGTSDLGPLRDPAVLAGCLTANGVRPGAPVLGSTQVVLRGQPGTLLLLAAGKVGVFTALVVGPGCSAGDPALLVAQQIGAP